MASHHILLQRRILTCQTTRLSNGKSLFNASCSSSRNYAPQKMVQQHQQHQQQQRRCVSTLILLRHGQSQWNGTEARFTGWCDVPLTVRGRVEAVAAGQLMRSRGFKASKVCVAFCSELQRSHETCELTLASMAGHEQHTWCSARIRRDWRLNERHYGAVQGHYKNDVALQQHYGEATLRYWRRSLHGKAPPMEPTHPYYLPPPAPLTESLYDCQQRVLSCWEDAIAPALFDEQGLPIPPDDRTTLVVAHANTIRSLMAHFDNVTDDHLVSQLYVPNSVPILYRFDRHQSKQTPISIKLSSSNGIASHARWMISNENHGAVRQAIAKGGTLTRALFDAMASHDFTAPTRFEITGAELEAGVRELMKDGTMNASIATDCVVVGVAKQIAREIGPHETIHVSEFERRTQEAYAGLTFKHLNEEDFVVPESFGVY
jgi:2,3-bisphosphoglycerate-dependent phosphoglycerate mutase